MKCVYCNSKVEPGWSYCSSCGHKLDRQNIFVNLINKHLDHIRKRFSAPMYDKGMKEASEGITISVTTGFGPPRINVNPSEQEEPEHYKKNREVKRKQPKEMHEPETIMKRMGRVIIINSHLPGVKSEKDIEINMLSNSVELRAYAGDKGYFKILKIPGAYDLVGKKFKDGKLRLQFSM